MIMAQRIVIVFTARFVIALVHAPLLPNAASVKWSSTAACEMLVQKAEHK